jgi:hypothetical protein
LPYTIHKAAHAQIVRDHDAGALLLMNQVGKGRDCLKGAPTPPAKVTSFAVQGEQAQRVSAISATLSRVSAPPTPILDAQFVEEQIGDNQLGPADFRAFMLIEIVTGDVAAWQSLLTPPDQQPTYAEPSQPNSWWLTEAHFATLQFYAPEALSSRANGWIAVDAKRGRIYVYSFTT